MTLRQELLSVADAEFQASEALLRAVKEEIQALKRRLGTV